MALSIPSGPAVSADTPNRNSKSVPEGSTQGFSKSLENLSSGLRQSGVGARPADYGEQSPESVRAAELSKNVRNANDSVSEARTATESLGQINTLLSRARSLAFGAINEPGRREREQDQAEFSKTLTDINEIAGRIQFNGQPLFAESKSFGPEGDLSRVDLSSFQGSIGSIQVIDRALSEISNQRGLLGIFQSSKLSQVGNLLREGVGGLVSSNSVVRSRVVAENLATSAAAELDQSPESSLLSSGTAAGQILASIVGRL